MPFFLNDTSRQVRNRPSCVQRGPGPESRQVDEAGKGRGLPSGSPPRGLRLLPSCWHPGLCSGPQVLGTVTKPRSGGHPDMLTPVPASVHTHTYLYLHPYIYIHTPGHVHTNTPVPAHIHTLIHVHTHTCACTCAYTHLHTYTHLCLHMCMAHTYTCTCTPVHVHTPGHAHTNTTVLHTYTHLYMHTHTCDSHVHTHLYTYTHTYVSKTHVYMCAQLGMYTHLCTYKHVHVHTHLLLHTCMDTHNLPWRVPAGEREHSSPYPRHIWAQGCPGAVPSARLASQRSNEPVPLQVSSLKRWATGASWGDC